MDATAPEKDVRAKKLIFLQALRCVAASMVVVTHAIEAMIRRGALPDDYDQVAWFFGWTGVTTFFVISGLIMTRTSWTSFGRPGAWRTFMYRRIARVVPPYWIATFLFAACTLIQGRDVTLPYLLKSLLFIPYVPASTQLIRPVAGQGWTLNYEMGFYVIFTLGLTLSSRRRGLSFVLGSLLSLVAVGAFIKPIVPYHDASSPLQFWTDPILVSFSVGILIGMFEMTRSRWHRFAYPLSGALLIFGVEGALCSLVAPEYRLPIFGVGCSLAVYLCTSARERLEGRAEQLLEAGGDASYSTYLLHPFVLMVLSAIWGRLPSTLQMPVPFVVVAIIASNVVGYVSYRLIETRIATTFGSPAFASRFLGTPRRQIGEGA